MDEIVKIVFIVDDNYFKYLFVSIMSLIMNTKHTLCVYIICENADEKSKSEMLKLFNTKNINIIFIEYLSKQNVEYKLKKEYMSRIAYAKYEIQDLIDEERVIYLDADLIVVGDIFRLWNEFNDNCIIQAVWNPLYIIDNELIGVDKTHRNFNSGVMLLNLKKFRSENIANKLISFTLDNNDKTRLHDQPAFNYVFKNTWCELDYCYNFQNIFYRRKYSDLGFTSKQFRKIIKNIVIIHFTGKDKPWKYSAAHPAKKIYLKYYKMCYGKIDYGTIKPSDYIRKIKKLSRLAILRINR